MLPWQLTENLSSSAKLLEINWKMEINTKTKTEIQIN